MGYVVYHDRTKSLIRWFNSERGAKISCTAMNKNAGKPAYAVMEERAFDKAHNQLVTVKNMMSGKEVQIKQQDVGGPCDPSTERYWSM